MRSGVRPNIALEPTANSFRSASAGGGGSLRAFGSLGTASVVPFESKPDKMRLKEAWLEA